MTPLLLVLSNRSIRGVWPVRVVAPGGWRTMGSVRLALATIVAASALATMSAGAQTQPQRLPEREAPSPCVAVDIGGQRAGHLDCAARRLEQAARQAQAQAGVAQGVSVPQAGSPDVRVGISSLSGTRQRMGSNLGKSIHPARPVVTPVNPLGPRR